MKMEGVKKNAKGPGIKRGYMKETDLIPQVQRTKGNFD